MTRRRWMGIWEGRLTRLLRSLDARRKRQDKNFNPWEARKVINKVLYRVTLSDRTRRIAACAVFRQARAFAGKDGDMLVACQTVLAEYLRFSECHDWTFTLMASMEIVGLRFTHADDTLAILSTIRRTAGFEPKLYTSIEQNELMARMNGLISELGKALPSVYIYTDNRTDPTSPPVLDQALRIYQESEGKIRLPDCWKLVCLARQHGLDVHLPAFCHKFGWHYLLALFALLEERRMDRAAFQQFNAAHLELTQLGVFGSIEVARAWDESARHIPLQDFARAATSDAMT